MKNLPYGVWRYVLLLIVLLVLAALASLSTVSYLETSPELRLAPQAVRIVSLKLLILTMGFLLLSGAFGLWAIRSTIEVESRRRIGRLVEAMNYLADGILAVDGKGRVSGSNAAARKLSPHPAREVGRMRDLFACLSAEDEALLLDTARPQEVERVSLREQSVRTLRFRSEPLEGMHVVLISDVSEQRSRDTQSQRAAQLQLIGRIAQGVAYDFNNILCTISGHASLLARKQDRPAEEKNSVQAVRKAAERGAALARQLQDLSRTPARGKPCPNLAEHVHKAVELVRIALPDGWQIRLQAQGNFGAVPFTGIQLEQLVLNLALLAADEREEPGVLHIEVSEADPVSARNAGIPLAAVVSVSTIDPERRSSEEALVRLETPAPGESGVILSVLRTIVEETGGRLELQITSSRCHQYRLLLPRVDLPPHSEHTLADVPDELKSYIGHWSVLLACPDRKDRQEMERRLTLLGVRVNTSDNLVSALDRVESGEVFQAMVFDKVLLGTDADGLLRAILKLQPGAGVVLLNESPNSVPPGLRSDVVFEPCGSAPDRVLQAMIKARELAGQRSRAA